MKLRIGYLVICFSIALLLSCAHHRQLAQSDCQLKLSWIDCSENESGFEIERKTGSEGTYRQIGTVGQNVTSYADTRLSEGTTYYYRVRAYNAAGHSTYSNEAHAETSPEGSIDKVK
jgi:hypothetical protein